MTYSSRDIETGGYLLDNAREFASLVRGLFMQDTLDQAIRDAMDEQVECGKEGRVQVFIPHGPTFTPSVFDDLLLDPHGYPLERGEASSGAQIYGRRNDAYLGTTVSGRHHPGFFVYDSGTALIVDFIDRSGKSKLNPMLRQAYLSMLEQEIGYSVAWDEKVLSAYDG